MTKKLPMKELERNLIGLMIQDPQYKESKGGNWRMFRYLELNEDMEFFVKGQKVNARWLAENMFPIENIRRVCQKLVESNPAVYGPQSEDSWIASELRQQETLDYVCSHAHLTQ